MICLKSLGALDAAVGAEVARRVAAGELSESELARRVGCSQGHVSNWSRGLRRASLGMVDAVLTELRLAPCELLGCASCAVSRPGVVLATVAAAVGMERPKQRRRPWRRRVDPAVAA